MLSALRKLAKYNQVMDSESAYEILTAKLEEASKKEVEEQEEKEEQKTTTKEKGFFDNSVVKQVGRTAAGIITRSLLGALGLGGRSRSRKSLF